MDIPAFEVRPHVWFAVFYFGMIAVGVYLLDTWHYITERHVPDDDEQ